MVIKFLYVYFFVLFHGRKKCVSSIRLFWMLTRRFLTTPPGTIDLQWHWFRLARWDVLSFWHETMARGSRESRAREKKGDAGLVVKLGSGKRDHAQPLSLLEKSLCKSFVPCPVSCQHFSGLWSL